MDYQCDSIFDEHVMLRVILHFKAYMAGARLGDEYGKVDHPAHAYLSDNYHTLVTCLRPKEARTMFPIRAPLLNLHNKYEYSCLRDVNLIHELLFSEKAKEKYKHGGADMKKYHSAIVNCFQFAKAEDILYTLLEINKLLPNGSKTDDYLNSISFPNDNKSLEFDEMGMCFRKVVSSILGFKLNKKKKNQIELLKHIDKIQEIADRYIKQYGSYKNYYYAMREELMQKAESMRAPEEPEQVEVKPETPPSRTKPRFMPHPMNGERPARRVNGSNANEVKNNEHPLS